MEYINSVHLRGKVAGIKVTESAKVARISIATEQTYENCAGARIGETTLHSVTVYERPGIRVDFNIGDPIDVKGRIKVTRFLNADGKTCSYWEIIATEVTKLK